MKAPVPHPKYGVHLCPVCQDTGGKDGTNVTLKCTNCGGSGRIELTDREQRMASLLNRLVIAHEDKAWYLPEADCSVIKEARSELLVAGFTEEDRRSKVEKAYAEGYNDHIPGRPYTDLWPDSRARQVSGKESA